MSKTRRCLLDLWIAACCVGLGLFLPWAFRWVENGEAVLLLLQLPVLLCGMLCGPGYGLSCGMLLALWELALYGFLAGFLTCLLANTPGVVNVGVSLVGSMLLGRVFYGLLNAFVFVPGYTWSLWLQESFVVCLPGIVLQLAVIPLVTLALRRCGVAERP